MVLKPNSSLARHGALIYLVP